MKEVTCKKEKENNRSESTTCALIGTTSNNVKEKDACDRVEKHDNARQLPAALRTSSSVNYSKVYFVVRAPLNVMIMLRIILLSYYDRQLKSTVKTNGKDKTPSIESLYVAAFHSELSYWHC